MISYSPETTADPPAFNSPELSGYAQSEWNTDIALAKTAVRIPKDKAFNQKDIIVWIGVQDYEDYGRLMLEYPIIESFSFLLTEDENKILLQ